MTVHIPRLTSYTLELMLILALASPSQTSCFSVVFERDRKFVGREDIIDKISEKFEVCRRVVLAGIGGVG